MGLRARPLLYIGLKGSGNGWEDLKRGWGPDSGWEGLDRGFENEDVGSMRGHVGV